MRRSICYCEPNQAVAGEIDTWKFIYVPSVNLPKGTLLKFDLLSEGRAIDWDLPETSTKKSGNIIYAMLEDEKVLSAQEVDVADRFTPQYLFTLPTAVEGGSPISIIVGAAKGKKTTEETGSRCQTTSQRRRTFNLYVDTTGKGHYDEPEVFTLDVRGGALTNIQVISPSSVIKNKRFDAIVRFEDEYGNLTSNAPEDTLIEVSYENLRENLTWKLFVPETGFITLPNMYFNEAGVYTIQLRIAQTGQIFKGFPIKCFAATEKHIFWGILHGESERIDSAENIESCLRHFRDEKGMSFFISSPFENAEETPNEIWRLISQNITELDEADRFSTILGFQVPGAQHSEGVRQIIYCKDQKQILRKKDAKGSSFKKMYKSFSPKELLSIPTFTMGTGYEYDWENFDPQFERVAEIYNAWGSSECSEKEGNTRPIKTLGKTGIKENAEGSIIGALKKNCRFGFVAGGLDDRGIYADLFDSEQEQYSPGLTAIIAPEHTRASLADALYRRSCFATTGARIIVGINIAGTNMGEEVSAADKPGLIVNRHVAGYAAGTCPLKKVEIIRNGSVIKTFEPKGPYALDFTYDDMEDLHKAVLKSPNDKEPPFAFYYIRVTQEDGQMAWSSPIWVDLIELTAAERKAKLNLKAALKKPAAKEIDDFDLEDDFEEIEDESE